MLIALNRRLRRGRRLVALPVVLLLCVTVLAAHGAVAGGHMAAGQAMVAMGHGTTGHTADGGADADPGASLMTMCLSIVQAAALALGALVLAAALAALHLRLPAPPWPAPSTLRRPTAALLCRARPPDLAVLQVSRR